MRQTDVKRASSLNAPTLGAGHNNDTTVVNLDTTKNEAVCQAWSTSIWEVTGHSPLRWKLGVGLLVMTFLTGALHRL